MKRSDAARRHRWAVSLIAAMAGGIVALLYAAVPWAEDRFDERGIEPEGATLAVIRAGHFVSDHLAPVLLLVAVLIGLLWSAFGALDRPRRRAADPEA